MVQSPGVGAGVGGVGVGAGGVGGVGGVGIGGGNVEFHLMVPVSVFVLYVTHVPLLKLRA